MVKMKLYQNYLTSIFKKDYCQ